MNIFCRKCSLLTALLNVSIYMIAVQLMPHSNAATRGNPKSLLFRASDVFLFIKSTISGLEILTHLFRQDSSPANSCNNKSREMSRGGRSANEFR
jgi:hypothetical protein